MDIVWVKTGVVKLDVVNCRGGLCPNCVRRTRPSLLPNCIIIPYCLIKPYCRGRFRYLSAFCTSPFCIRNALSNVQRYADRTGGQCSYYYSCCCFFRSLTVAVNPSPLLKQAVFVGGSGVPPFNSY